MENYKLIPNQELVSNPEEQKRKNKRKNEDERENSNKKKFIEGEPKLRCGFQLDDPDSIKEGRRRVVIDQGIRKKFCNHCKRLLQVEANFSSRRNRGKVTYAPLCIECTLALPNKSLDARFTVMIRNARNNSYNRKKRGRSEAGTFSLQKANLHQLYAEQSGQCFISKIPLTLSGQWQMSLERKKTILGYTYPDNVCLIALEFQSTDSIVNHRIVNSADSTFIPTTSTWTREKFLEARNLMEVQISVEEQKEVCNHVEHALEIKRSFPKCFRRTFYPPRARELKDRFLLEEALCTKCHKMLPNSKFYFEPNSERWHKLSNYCKQCSSECSSRHINRLRGKCRLFINNAKSHTKKCKLPEMTLILNEVINKYKVQMSRCFYSGNVSNFFVFCC